MYTRDYTMLGAASTNYSSTHIALDDDDDVDKVWEQY